MDKIKQIGQALWRYEIVHIAVFASLLNMIIECLNKKSLIGLVTPFTNPVIFFYNVIIIMATMAIVVFFKRKIFIYSIISFIWLLLAIINFVVLCSRKTPFTAMDIYLLKDALKVIPLYLNVFQIILIILGVIVALTGLVLLWIKGPKSSRRINYIHGLIKAASIALVLYGTTNLFLYTGSISGYFGNLAKAYKQYGFAYCFTCSVVDRGISKSSDYSEQYINDLKQTIDSEISNTNSETTPNIIFLQLESFFDPNNVIGTEYSLNPVSNFERLSSEYSSGYLSVPCFGAGTANTEFEVQTGINLDDFGPGEYPYKTVLQSAICESTAYDLKNLGYATHALHNNDATFYDRYKVFSHLGYDTFSSIEYMSNIEVTPEGWAKDKILTGEIEKILDSTSGSDYIYTISVQGHGDYPSTMPEGYTPKIKVSGFFDQSAASSYEYYVNQIYEMDQFIGELTAYLNERDEETVLVMYGDHLPTFEFTNEKLKNHDIYQTPYVIWSNFEQQRSKKNMEAFQLSSYVLGNLSISEGYITKFHQTQSTTTDYLKNLKILEYDILYGDCSIYGGTNPYKETKLQMGINTITITDAFNYKNYCCVEGENYNDYSVVLINDKEYETEIINDHLLKVKQTKLKVGDEVSVIQRGKDKIELSRVTFKVTSLENP
jgi:phosphoglycerol transferase MdoB-like AlkP superfamily enzyme